MVKSEFCGKEAIILMLNAIYKKIFIKNDSREKHAIMPHHVIVLYSDEFSKKKISMNTEMATVSHHPISSPLLDSLG